jgi:phospholipid/cholesterol/gamma-HCH transport system substrate-binding protein
MDRRNTPRTHYIHRLSYSAQERMVGAFLLIAAGILIWLLFSAGASQISFDEYFTLYGELESEQAVNNNTEVIISGLNAGKVEDVRINESNRVVVKLRMLERYHSLVRSDTVAHINAFNFGVISKSVIELSAGNPALPLLDDGSTIKIQSSFDIKQLMAKVTPTLDNLANTIDHANQLLAAIDPAVVKDSINNLNAVSRQVLAITEEIKSGKGFANKLIYDDAMANNMLAVSNNLNNASAHIDELISSIHKDLESVPDLLNKVEPLLKEADKTIKATQRIWPLSSALSDEKKSEQLTPQAPAND